MQVLRQTIEQISIVSRKPSISIIVAKVKLTFCLYSYDFIFFIHIMYENIYDNNIYFNYYFIKNIIIIIS
jgi:hypothetical protein